MSTISAMRSATAAGSPRRGSSVDAPCQAAYSDAVARTIVASGTIQRIAGEVVGLVQLGDGALELAVGVVGLSLLVELLGVLRLGGRGQGDAAGADDHREREMEWGSHGTAEA